MVLVNDPIVPANLFVATAADGGRPTNISAGKEISPPPSTTESINAARKPKKIRMGKMFTSKSKGTAVHLFSIIII